MTATRDRAIFEAQLSGVRTGANPWTHAEVLAAFDRAIAGLAEGSHE